MEETTDDGLLPVGKTLLVLEDSGLVTVGIDNEIGIEPEGVSVVTARDSVHGMGIKDVIYVVEQVGLPSLQIVS